MGVRSMATLVVSGEQRILIDPGAAIAPLRFKLPPSEAEKKKLSQLKTNMNDALKECTVIVITHFHRDHYEPRPVDDYSDKKIFLKSWESDINYNQRKRARSLYQTLKEITKPDLIYECDGSRHILEGGCQLQFSTAVPHGNVGTNIGYVIMVTVREPGFTFLYTSDVQGPAEASTARMIIDSKPDLVYIDGPPTHLLKTHFKQENLDKAINNILDIITLSRTRLILDHHLLRDIQYRDQLEKIYNDNQRVFTAAEYIDQENNLYEAQRNKLWNTVGDLIG